METVTVQKELFQTFVTDLERLLTDFENMIDASVQIEAEKRLEDIRAKEVEPLTEEDYKKFIKKKGVVDE